METTRKEAWEKGYTDFIMGQPLKCPYFEVELSLKYKVGYCTAQLEQSILIKQIVQEASPWA